MVDSESEGYLFVANLEIDIVPGSVEESDFD